MSATVLQSDHAGEPDQTLQKVRVQGGISLRVAVRDGRSRAADVSERDGYKLRFPRNDGSHPQAVIINTGGGLVGGDSVAQSVEVAAGAEATVTTQSAERVYRALGSATTAIGVKLDIADGGCINWLPQETIVFDRARLRRDFDVGIAGEGRCVLAETLVFGRMAFGEQVRSGNLRDTWRIRIDGRLVFAENVVLDGDVTDRLSLSAVAGGAHVVGTVVAAGGDVADRLERVRAELSGTRCRVAASAWGALLVVRALGERSRDVRDAFMRALPILTGAALPRVWSS